MTALGGLVLALGVAVPLAWKWELGVVRVAAVVAALALLATAAVTALAAGLAAPAQSVAGAGLALALATGILAYRFYRDPERTPPDVPEDAVVSPADGEVVYVRRSRGGVLPRATKHGRDHELVELTRTPLRSGEAIVIGIAMSFLDVHVNRAPIAGRVGARAHFPGRFGSLGRPEMIFENERATMVIERGRDQVAMVQIASRLVRQIASYVDTGQQLVRGQRVGVIRLGSQVDLVLPARPGVEVRVAAGQRVRAGETVIAWLGPDRPVGDREPPGA
jgi:phosphatidylserine decarboxylase